VLKQEVNGLIEASRIDERSRCVQRGKIEARI
jgi:hypothetical protein